MLASQRTRLLERGHALMVAFDPAQILPAGTNTPLSCAMGPFRQLARSLQAGGQLPNYQIAFRITRSLFPTAATGGRLQWRLPGETLWRETLTIETILDRPSVPYIILGCGNVNQ